jgi:Zn-dependent oligopeptidase
MKGLKDEVVFLKSLEEVCKIQQEFTDLPLGKVEELKQNLSQSSSSLALKQLICQNLQFMPSMSLLNHGHFVNYGASYYSYMLARLYAAQIWYKLFEKDPLSR